MKKINVLMGLILLIANIFAEDKAENRNGFAAAPFLIYTGETSFTAGGFVVKTFRKDSVGDSIPPSSFVVNSMLSVKKNFLSFFNADLVLDEGKVIITPYLKYQNWPSEYYGMGRNSQEDDESSYTQETFEIKTDLKYKFANNLFAKGGLRYQNAHIHNREEASLIYTDRENTYSDQLAGFGAGIEFDSRNNSFYPDKGIYLYAGITKNLKAFGLDNHKTGRDLDLKYYHSAGANGVLAYQAKLELNDGRSPFYEKALLGEELRAYSNNRYIDDNLYALKTEYRSFPWESGWKKRFGYVIFAEGGQVFNKISEVKSNRFKYSVGTGLRFAIIPKEKLNFRFDLAKGDNSFQVIFIAREAF